MGDAVALSLSAAQLVAAYARAALLADPADADLGLHEPVPLRQQQLCLPRLRRAARGGHAVGCTVPWPAGPFDVVSRGDVGAQSRASLRHPVAAIRVGPVVVVDEHDPRFAWDDAGGAAGDPALSLLDLLIGAAPCRVLRGARDPRLGARVGDLRADPATGNGSGGTGLDRRLHALADQLRLLPGVDLAWLAAACRLGAALDLRVRGNARGVVQRDLPHRFPLHRARARRRLYRAGRRRFFRCIPQRAPARRIVTN